MDVTNAKVESELVQRTNTLALISEADDTVWIVVPRRWWDLATLMWWLFIPFDRKKMVKVKMRDGQVCRARAVRVASYYARVRGVG
jgi:hypothetical protein